MALPIQRFSPFSSHCEPSKDAVVRSPAATSEPPVGSVSANAPIWSKEAMAGSHRERCDGEPQVAMLPMARPLCTP